MNAESTKPRPSREVGWQDRTSTHLEEVRGTQLWLPCGVNSESAPLRAVLLSWPSEALSRALPPSDFLLDGPVDPIEMREEALALAATYRDLGVQVHMDRPVSPPQPNYVFMRDLFFMTPEGAILARPAAAQRAGEERRAAAALAFLGVPILTTLRGGATFEGADALWLGPDSVVIGVGNRTNEEGFAAVARTLADQGITAYSVPAPVGAQHLLGSLNFLDSDLAAALAPLLTEPLARLLSRHDIELVELELNEETRGVRSMNFVATSPRNVVLPAGCPKTISQLERHGVRCVPVFIGQYLAAAGGVGCATGILHRC